IVGEGGKPHLQRRPAHGNEDESKGQANGCDEIGELGRQECLPGLLPPDSRGTKPVCKPCGRRRESRFALHAALCLALFSLWLCRKGLPCLCLAFPPTTRAHPWRGEDRSGPFPTSVRGGRPPLDGPGR